MAAHRTVGLARFAGAGLGIAVSELTVATIIGHLPWDQPWSGFGLKTPAMAG